MLPCLRTVACVTVMRCRGSLRCSTSAGPTVRNCDSRVAITLLPPQSARGGVINKWLSECCGPPFGESIALGGGHVEAELGAAEQHVLGSSRPFALVHPARLHFGET